MSKFTQAIHGDMSKLGKRIEKKEASKVIISAYPATQGNFHVDAWPAVVLLSPHVAEPTQPVGVVVVAAVAY